MSDKIYLGNRAARIDTDDALMPISKVIINADSENLFIAGDDTGRTIEASCPWATQDMANSLLDAVKGVIYQPYSADDALLDPAVELGDGITLGGVYSVLARSDEFIDSLYSADISAPGGDEIDDEYPYISKQERQTKRENAKTRSLITKTADEIRLEVSSELEGLSSSIDVSLSEISASVSNNANAIAALDLYVNSITLSVSNGSESSELKLMAGETVLASAEINFSGVVTFSGLQSGETKINGGWLESGTVVADKLKGEKVQILDTDDAPIGSFTITRAESAVSALEINSYTALRLISQRGDIFIGADYNLTLSGAMGVFCQNHFIPSSNNTYSVGTAEYGWLDIYAAGTTFSALISRVEALESKLEG